MIPADVIDSRDSKRLPTISRTWRLLVVVVGLVILGAAQLVDTNDWFPLGSLSQYGAAKDPNGSVVTFYLDADTTAGTRVRVDLSPDGVGVGRSEIESQVSRIRADPSLLQGIAHAQAEMHPHAPQFTVLYLMRSQSRLHDGKAVGEPTVTTSTRWQVP